MKNGFKKEDKAMRKELILTVALLGAVAATLSCQKAQDVTPKTYSLSIDATKGANDEAVKALALSSSTLNATWATTENVYVKKGETWATGSLQPQTAAATATLKGTLSGVTFAANDNITLQFPKNGDITYSGQVGTLEDIAANFDWATASSTVASVDEGKITVDGDVAFQNQQAIVKFTLKNKADDSDLSATKLVVKVGGTEYEVNPAAAASEIFVALPGFSSQDITLTATGSDSKTYIYSKSDVTFANGKYYTRTVKMVDANAPLSGVFTVAAGKTVKFSKGNLQYTKSTSTWSFMENQYSTVETSDQNVGTDYASQDVVSLFGWGTSGWNNGNAFYQPYNTSNATSGTYTSSNGYGYGPTDGSTYTFSLTGTYANADWGASIGSGWRTLTGGSGGEWEWILGPSSSPTPGTNCRNSSTIGTQENARFVKATVHSTTGLIIFPDEITWNASTMGAAPATCNTANSDFTYSPSDDNWTALETAGCVFLPAAGYRNGTSVSDVGSCGTYWSSSPDGASYAYCLSFRSSNVSPAGSNCRYDGRSVRLVQDQQ